jgi:hypothetical protein
MFRYRNLAQRLYLSCFVVPLLLVSPAQAGELTDRIDAATHRVTVGAPWVTEELCQALQRAEARFPDIHLNTMPPDAAHPFTCVLARGVFYYDIAVAGAFVLIDGTRAGTGPDIEHLTFRDDPDSFADAMLHYATALVIGVDKRNRQPHP